MDWKERIIIDPEVMLGKPVIKGTRLTVEFIFCLIAAGWTIPRILENYPGTTREDILACAEFMEEMISKWKESKQ